MFALDGKLSRLILLFLIFVSLFGLMLAIFFAFVSPEVQEDFALRKPLVGLALSVVCLLGILAVLYPASCMGLISFKNPSDAGHSFHGPRTEILRGHHAACRPYSTHVLKLGSRVFCATCSGLLVGAVIVFVGVGLFFFWNLRFGEERSVLVLAGVAGVAAGLLYAVMPLRFQSGFTRFLAGALLPTGSFLIIVGVEEAAKNLSIDLFFVALSLLWLATKMSLSQWEHRRICGRCSLVSCSSE